MYYSISLNFFKYFIGKKIVFDYWEALAKAFNDDSHARLMDLRCQLQTLRKGSMTIE